MNSSLQSYAANCHCGKVKFTITLPDIRTSKINRCNCSICTKNGYLLVYPQKENVVFGSGQESLSSYLFGNRKKPHKFCSQCGTRILIDFSNSDHAIERTVTAINIRTIAGIEDMWGELGFRDVDGKTKLGPPYQVSQ